MDWSNQTHLMQALLVACCVFSFMVGYRSGDKT